MSYTNDLRLKPNIISALVFILFCFSFIPNFILYIYPTMQEFYNYLIVISFVGGIAINLLHGCKIKINSVTVFISLYIFVVIFSTIYNDGSITKVIYESMKIVTPLLILRPFKYSIESVLNGVRIYSLVNLFFYIAVYIIYPNGFIYEGRVNYYFDLTNENINYVISLVTFAVLYYLYTSKKINFLASVIIFTPLILTFTIDSSTTKLGILLYIMLFLFLKYFKLKKLSVKLFFTYLISVVAILFFHIQKLFKWLIVDILKEDITLHNRTTVWEIAISELNKSPIFGFGYDIQIYKYNYISRVTNGYFSHTHNEILEILIRSGFIGVTLFLIFLFGISLKVDAINSKYKNLLIPTLFVYMIMSISETVFTQYFYILIALILFLPIYTSRNHKNELI